MAGRPLLWIVQYCSSVRPYKGPFTWSDCVSWTTIDKFKTKKEADTFLQEERKKRKHSFVGAALRVYPIYPAVTLNKYRGGSNPLKDPAISDALYESLAAEVPDVDDPNLINYWKTVDDRQIYLEGWCDKCFAGTGIGKYETQAKINYAEDLTRLVLPRKAKERGLELIEGRFVETSDKDFLVGVTVGVYRKKTENPIGYRVGEPQETNAKKLIEFEVVESGNVPMLDDLAKALKCQPTLESINWAIDDQFGADAIGMWLCDSPEWAEKRYGPGEAYSVEIPSDAILTTDLGEDGKLWIWGKEPRAARRWRLRVRADTLLKEIREEKARIGV